MPRFTGTAGYRLWYEECGSGPPVVLIHGWCMSSVVWRFQQEGLSGSSRVIAADLPGHGRTPSDGSGFSIEGCARDIVALFDRLDLSGALLVGWSLGSMVALQAADGLKGRLTGLVLVGATPRFTQGEGFPCGLTRFEADGMAVKVRRNMRRALDGFTGRMFAPGEMDDPQQAELIRQLLSSVPLPSVDLALQALAALVGADLRDRLPLLRLPTLIVNGDSDVICLPQASAFMAQQIPGAGQAVFEGCGHAPFLTRAVRFNAVLKEFQRRVGGRDN